MKNRMITLLLIILLVVPCIVYAGGSDDDNNGVTGATMGTKNCYYVSKNERQTSYVHLTLYGLGPAMSQSVAVESYFYDNQGNGEKHVTLDVNNFDGQDYIYNYMHHYDTYFALNNHFSIISMRISEGEADLLDNDNHEACPSTVFEITYLDKKNNKKNSYFLCNGYNSDLGQDTCANAENFLKNTDKFGTNPSIVKHTFTTSTAFNNLNQESSSHTNINDTYNEILDDIDVVCDKESEHYDEDKCRALNDSVDDIKDQNSDLVEEENLHRVELPEVEIITQTCDSLLGSVTTKGSPAFYLATIFSVLRYVAIAIIIVMTTLDFVGAVSSHDNEIIKKAVNKLLKRAILCVIIFLLPTIIEFVLQFVHNRTITTCDIGK